MDRTGVPDTPISQLVQVTAAVAIPAMAFLAVVAVLMWLIQRRRNVTDGARLWWGGVLMLVLGAVVVTGLALEGPVVPRWLSLTLLLSGSVAGLFVGQMMRGEPDAAP